MFLKENNMKIQAIFLLLVLFVSSLHCAPSNSDTDVVINDELPDEIQEKVCNYLFDIDEISYFTFNSKHLGTCLQANKRLHELILTRVHSKITKYMNYYLEEEGMSTRALAARIAMDRDILPFEWNTLVKRKDTTLHHCGQFAMIAASLANFEFYKIVDSNCSLLHQMRKFAVLTAFFSNKASLEKRRDFVKKWMEDNQRKSSILGKLWNNGIANFNVDNAIGDFFDRPIVSDSGRKTIEFYLWSTTTSNSNENLDKYYNDAFNCLAYQRNLINFRPVELLNVQYTYLKQDPYYTSDRFRTTKVHGVQSVIAKVLQMPITQENRWFPLNSIVYLIQAGAMFRDKRELNSSVTQFLSNLDKFLQDFELGRPGQEVLQLINEIVRLLSLFDPVIVRDGYYDERILGLITKLSANGENGKIASQRIEKLLYSRNN